MSLKIIPFIVFLGLFLLFAAPVATGIINLGNGVGMALSAVMMLIVLFWGKFTGALGRCWEKPLGKIVLSLVGIAAAVSIVLAVVISVFMIREANDPPEDENTTVVVLGCKVKNGAPSLMLKRRLDAAYGYLSEHDSVCAVVSGGQGSDESISEAQCMKDYTPLWSEGSDYTYEAKGCDGGKCKSYELRSNMEKEEEYIKTSRN